VRKPHEQPSVGVLLCATKDDEVVKYALSRTLSPALSTRRGCPRRHCLQSKLHEFYELAKAEAALPTKKMTRKRKP
jgi:hypothetical protein